MSETLNSYEEVVFFMVINRIETLPRLSIESCLKNTNSNIVIAYLNESDLDCLPKSKRISYLHVRSIKSCEDLLAGLVHDTYQNFTTEEFYTIVQLKWHVFLTLFEIGYRRVIYSDLDVIWIQDGVLETRKRSPENYSILIQDASMDVGIPRLCMGFVSIVNSPRNIEAVKECMLLNKNGLLINATYGDDEAITDYYIKNSEPNWIFRLPQVTFPLGYSLDSYSRKSKYPNIHRIKPVIFHLNYVIGTDSKILLAYIFNKENGMGLNFDRPNLYFEVILLFRRVKGKLGRLLRILKLKR